MEDIIKKTEGTLYVGNQLSLPKTDLNVIIDKEKAGIMGVLPAEVARTVRLSVAGLPNQTVRNADGDEFQIQMTLQDFEFKRSRHWRPLLELLDFYFSSGNLIVSSPQ